MIDTAALLRAADEEKASLLPKRYPCAPDLVNLTPTDLTHRSDGTRIAGSLLVTDIYPGSPSPAAWMYALPLMIAGVFAVVMGVLALVIGTWVPLTSIKSAFHAYQWAGFSMPGATGMAIVSTYTGFFVANVIAWVPVFVIAAIGWLCVSEMEATHDTYHWYWYSFVLLSAAALVPIAGALIATSLIGNRLSPMVRAALVILSPLLTPLVIVAIGIVAIFAPRIAMWSLERGRNQNLRDATEDSKNVGQDPELENKRMLQAARSLMDTSPLIPLAKSCGHLRRSGDPLTPDPGKMIHMSVEDSSTHVAVIGKTGTGKTVFLKNFMGAWIRLNLGGALVLDPGKGQLALDLMKDLDVVLSPENHHINLLEGLSPEEASKIIYRTTKKGAQNNDVWNDGAEEMLRFALTVIRDARTRPAIRAVVGFSIRHGFKFCQDEGFRNAILSSLQESTNDTSRIARHYWQAIWPGMAAETCSSLNFTLAAMVSCVASSEKLEKWVGDRSDFNIPELVAHGKRIGIAVNPTIGTGAALATALIAGAMDARMAKRSSNPQWKAQGEVPVLRLGDEYTDALSEADIITGRVARSQSYHIVTAFQDIDGVIAKLGSEDAANSYLNQFRNLIYLKSSKKSTEFAVEFAGHRQRFVSGEDKVEAAPMLKNLSATQASGLVEGQRGRMLDTVATVTGVAARVRKSFTTTTHANQSDANPLRKTATLTGQFKHMATITAEELDVALETPFNALVVVNRAGAPHREICSLTPPAIQAVVNGIASKGEKM